jgi:hypothetical protein
MPKWLDRVVPHLDIEGTHVPPVDADQQPRPELVSV